MRKLAAITAVFLLLCATAALAVDCTDSDRDDDVKKTIDEKGSVTYGLTEKYDECVSSEDGYHMGTSRFVREYFCQADSGGNILRKYEDIDCERYGYTKCEDGRCIGKNTTASYTGTTSQPAGPSCGNKKIDAGEQCDPPDKICYDDNSNIGQCTRPNAKGFGGCQCKTLGDTEKVETPVQNTTTVTTTTTTAPAAQPATPPATAPAAQPAPTTPPAEQAPEERAPLPTEDLDSSNGIGITRGITNAVKKFFRWIGSWFG
jgi:hypothetical protein